MVDVKCFFIKPSDRVQRSLRRYTSSTDKPCSAGGKYCNASIPLDVIEDEDHASGDSWPHEDARWPSSCSKCGTAFADDDQWQLSHKHLYVSEDGREMTLLEAAAGAMWDAHWMPSSRRGPDGMCLVVKLPDGVDWTVDFPANNGPGWTRSGDVPNVTARPSIGTPGYHGFLTNGVLKSC